MRHTLQIYLHYFLQFLKTRLSYRWDFCAGLISNILISLTGLLFIYFLVDGETVNNLKGWNRAEVMFIYGYSMISMALFSSIAINLYGFGDRYIIQGQFDRVLLRPLNSLCQVLFESFNFDSIGSLVVGIAVMLQAARSLGIRFGLLDLGWLGLSSICGAIILTSVFVTLASVSFHFEDRLGIAPPFYNLIAFGRYPLPIFSRALQFFLSWVVPFAFVAFYPATYFFNRAGFKTLCFLMPVVAFLSISVAYLAWRFGVSKYESTGN